MTIKVERLTIDLPIYNVSARSLRHQMIDLTVGGKLMRTVSFLGCTLPVDFFIGSAP